MGGWWSAHDVIAKFENYEWSLYGNLQKGRRGHGSIIFGTDMLVIGGDNDDYGSSRA